MAFTNQEKLLYLLKSDLGKILKSDGYGILIETPIGSNVFSNTSKNTGIITNQSKNTASWANTSKS